MCRLQYPRNLRMSLWLKRINQSLLSVLIKVNWPPNIKAKASKLLTSHSLNYVFGHFDYANSRSTLQYWRKSLSFKGLPKKCGRPIKFPELDEDIFNAFIICRERHLPMSGSKLVEIANTIRNEHVENFKEQRSQLINLEGLGFRDDWMPQFKKRRHIQKRKITTAITKGLCYYLAKIT